MEFLMSRFPIILLAVAALIFYQNHVILTKMTEIDELHVSLDTNNTKKDALPNNALQIVGDTIQPEQNESGNVGTSANKGPIQPLQKEKLESFSGKEIDDVPHSCDIVPGKGTEGFGGYIVLEKVRNRLLEVQQELKKSQNKLPSVLCIVQTRRGRENLLESIQNTWGKQCDKLLVVSNTEVPGNNVINISPMMGEDTLENRWQKIRAIWNFVRDKYLGEYEYFHICNDETYMVLDNLRAYLGGPEVESLLNGTRSVAFDKIVEKRGYDFKKYPDRPLILGQASHAGRKFKIGPGENCGYTMNRAAVRAFEAVASDCKFVNSTTNSDMTGECFRLSRHHQLWIVDTRDEDGAYRYHTVSANFQATMILPSANWNPKWIDEEFPSQHLVYGPKGASRESVAFYLGSTTEPMKKETHDEEENIINRMYRYHAILNGQCRYGLLVPTPPAKMSIDPKRMTMTKNTDELVKIGCSNEKGKGTEGEGGYKVLEKVRLGVIESKQSNEELATSESPRILCMIYTHSGRKDFVQAIVNTWGNQCDGFFASSNVTDPSTGSINIPHIGEESYDNMWQKVRSMWAYAYDNFLDSYDYYHIAGDDTFVVVENLRAFLAGPDVEVLLNGTKRIAWHADLEDEGWDFEKSPNRPLLLGQASFMRKGHDIFPGGGSGYTLNREALRLFGKEILPSYHVPTISAMEDQLLGFSFSRSLQVCVADTTDKTGAFRYHMESAEFQAKLDSGLAPWSPDQLESIFGFKTLYGVEGASKQSVAFHLKGGAVKYSDQGQGTEYERKDDDQTIINRIYRYHAILNGLCE